MGNNNDLIRRGDVEKIICDGLDNKKYGYDVVCVLADLREIPAIEQPMSALEYYEIWQRCCSFYSRTLCRGCPLFVKEMCRDSGVPTPANIAAIQKWAREHPGRSEGCSK